MSKKFKIPLLSLILLLVHFNFSAAASYDVLLSSPFRVTNSKVASQYPAIAVDATGRVYAAWTESEWQYGWFDALYYTNIDISASPEPVLLSYGIGLYQGEPSLAVGPGNRLHVNWHNWGTWSEEMIHRSVAADGSIGNWTRMTQTNFVNTDVPRIAVDQNHGVHIVYTSEHLGGYLNFNLFYKKFNYDPSTDSLTEAVFPIALTTDGGMYQICDLSLDSAGDVHIAWQDDGGIVNYIKLDGNNGSILVPKTSVSSSSSLFPSIKVDHLDNVHIVWIKANDIFYKKFDKNGNVLVIDTPVTTTAASAAPGIVIDSHGKPHVAWKDTRNGNPELYYAMLGSGDGAKLTEETAATDLDGYDSSWFWPAIAIAGDDTVHIAWQDMKDGNQEIYYRQIKVKERNRAPVASAGPDQSVEMTSCAGANVTLDGSGSSDPDGDALTYTWNENGNVIATGVNPTVTLSYGSHAITLTVDDGKGGTDSDEVAINVVDTTAPALSVSINPDVLWPPNHKYVTVTPAISATDACAETVTVQRLSASSSEPDNGLGDGDTANDIVTNADGTISLRAERSGKGSGRVYTIMYQATDVAGNSANASATVTVLDHM